MWQCLLFLLLNSPLPIKACLSSNEGCDPGSVMEAKQLFHAGANTTLEGVIVDRNASVASGCKLVNKDRVSEADRAQQGFVITDGIITVLKSAVLQPGTTI